MPTMSNVFHRKQHHQTTDEKDNENTSSSSLKITRNGEVNILFGLIVFRLCNIALVQTWFVPDEYWQGPEIAHKMAFGYGYETWEWKEGIRGYSYPLVFAILYKCIQFLRIDWPMVVIYLPRIFQAVHGAVGEYYGYKFSKILCGTRTAWWMLFCQVTSWFTFYCITRTITNSMETAWISIALYFWQLSQTNDLPEPRKRHSLHKALLLASLSCLVRPTAFIVWVPLGIARLWNSKSWFNFLFKFIIPVGILAMVISVLIDSWFYNKFTLVQYNFVYFNIMKNIGELYGTHPWYWYLTQGVPVVVASHLIPFCIGLYCSGKRLLSWFLLIVINISVYSVLSHKEFRFILPLTPIIMCICGEGMHQIADKHTMNIKKDYRRETMKDYSFTMKGKMLAVFLIITNVPVALYTGLLHQRGTLDVMTALGKQVHSKNNSNFNVLFLMPCHSTPYYSYIHRKINMKFLDCTPSTKPGYIDEADQFYLNPMKWLNKTYDGKKIQYLPSHIIFFDVLLKDVEDFLRKHMYTKCGNFFYSHFPSGRLGCSVFLYCKLNIEQSV